MTEQTSSPPWRQAGWLAEATAWIQAEVARQGFRISGEIEQPHIRPWSTVLKVPTDQGVLFMKATVPVLGHEPGLTQALAGWRPDCMPAVLAADLDRGWFLMPDLGVTLRSLMQAPQDLSHWERVLPLYAEVQMQMVDRVQTLLGLGILDRRLAGLPAHYAALLADTPALLIAQPDGLSAAQYGQLQELGPRVAEMCQQLDAAGIPETLHHDDFHDANIFVRDGRYILSDWAESCVTHPFFSLLVAMRGVVYRQKVADDGPEVARLRDAYLEPWGRFGSPQALRDVFDLALQLAPVCRTLTWYRVVSSLEGADRAQYAEAVPGWLQEALSVMTGATRPWQL